MKGLGTMQPGWVGRWAARARRRLGRDDEHGAVLVEAAIIIPLIVLLTFGAIEFGFAFNEQGTTRSATRTAARAASTQPKAPAPAFENAAIRTLNRSAENLATGTPVEAWIYRARNIDGDPELERPTTCVTAALDGDCRLYTWTPGTGFDETAGTGNAWNPNERAACAGLSDSVGVYLVVKHKWLTGLPFNGSDGVTLSSNTIMSLEPFPAAACGTTP